MNSLAGFLRENARWVAGGFLLTFFSSYGQTFFISLSAGHIRAEYGLSHGGFGALYMVATLASALTLPQIGKLVGALARYILAFHHHLAARRRIGLSSLRGAGHGSRCENRFAQAQGRPVEGVAC